MEMETKFLVCGYVKRKWVSDKGNFGTLTVDTKSGTHETIVTLRSFKDGDIDGIRALSEGQMVRVTGVISDEKLTDKQKNDVKVDGYNVYTTRLNIKKVEVDKTSQRPAPNTNNGAGW